MHRHEFDCAECGRHIVHESDLTTGYGLDRQQRKVCFDCCGKRDRQSMIDTGHSRHLPLYLTSKDGKYEVTNWPGTLRFKVTRHWTSKHNLGGTRTDVWFVGPDGHVWHGVQIGEWNEMIAGQFGALNDMLKASGSGMGVESPITEFPDFERLEFKGQQNVGPFLQAMKQLADQERAKQAQSA